LDSAEASAPLISCPSVHPTPHLLGGHWMSCPLVSGKGFSAALLIRRGEVVIRRLAYRTSCYYELCTSPNVAVEAPTVVDNAPRYPPCLCHSGTALFVTSYGSDTGITVLTKIPLRRVTERRCCCCCTSRPQCCVPHWPPTIAFRGNHPANFPITILRYLLLSPLSDIAVHTRPIATAHAETCRIHYRRRRTHAAAAVLMPPPLCIPTLLCWPYVVVPTPTNTC